MESLRELYRIGIGPSSSHTMGPARAARLFFQDHTDASRFRVTLYGSLAATGKGHLTDQAVLRELPEDRTVIVWRPDVNLPAHPNGMRFEALDEDGNSANEWLYFSVGGGALAGSTDSAGTALSPDRIGSSPQADYPLTTMRELLPWAEKEGKSFWEYVFDHEDGGFADYLAEVWKTMQAAIQRGIDNEGLIPGPLKLPRKASAYAMKSRNAGGFIHSISTTFAYALAVSEENACGGTVVTAPTCGASGVLPAVLKTLQETFQFQDSRIIRALATAGLIGNLVKTNGSISGAEVGCQGEVGTACAMAAAAAAQLLGGTPRQIEYAAEMGLEHHLGLTCDPVLGLVQIPCIERNAVAATRAIDAAAYATLSDGRHLVSFDEVIDTMLQTGRDMSANYRETSAGGLAKFYNRDELEEEARL
ncbi:MAG: L-serine ammonia-lyase [Sediminispirochaetaceae bacterium]